MIGRWLTYIKLAFLDLVRLWSTTQHHVIIVAGICLPILLLLGLKRGHVAELRKALLTSPTGRQVVFGSSQHGALLDREGVARLQKELPGVETIVPDLFRLVKLRVMGKPTVDEVMLYATRNPDPLLSHMGAVLPAADERTLVLGEGVAGQLGVKPGGSVEVIVSRQNQGQQETAKVELRVSSIIATPDPSARVGYVDLGILDRVMAWGQGFRIAEFGWPAGGIPQAPEFTSYIVFCKKDKPFTKDDINDLEFRFEVREITGKLSPALNRLLVPGKSNDLRIYQLTSRDPRKRLAIPFRDDVWNPEAFSADPVIIPWNEPLNARIDGNSWSLIGVTFRKDPWLRSQGFIREEVLLDNTSEEPYQVRPIQVKEAPRETSLAWPLRAGGPVKLRIVGGKPTQTTAADNLGVVPAEVLAWFTGAGEGLIEFDPERKIFTRPSAAQIYNRARLYARTIDDVPAVVDALQARNFSVSAEQARIKEIHRQDASLQLLVLVVGVGVFLFGILTVVSVLHDSTDRKRGTIGILRVMGTSRSGIFLLIFIRAAVIGLLASALCAALGWGLSWLLGWQPPASMAWKPIIAVHLEPMDYVYVALGSLLCCMLGALWPAWRASRLDPFDAIVEGRFK